MFDDDPAPDLSNEEPWSTPAVINAVNTLVEVLYSEGCNVNPLEIIVSRTPTGEPLERNGDYGKVTIREMDVV